MPRGIGRESYSPGPEPVRSHVLQSKKCAFSLQSLIKFRASSMVSVAPIRRTHIFASVQISVFAVSPKQPLDSLPDNFFATCDFLLALLEVISGNRLEVIDVIEVDILHEINLRLNIARHGDIDQEQSSIPPELHQRRQFRAIQDVMRRRSAA